jgi:hypothetical protein
MSDNSIDELVSRVYSEEYKGLAAICLASRGAVERHDGVRSTLSGIGRFGHVPLPLMSG